MDRAKLPSLYHALSAEGKRELLRAALYFHRVTMDGGAAGASQEDCDGFLFVVRKAEKESGISIIGERITVDDVRLVAASYREPLEQMAQTFYDIVRKNQDPSYHPPREAFERFRFIDEANSFLKSAKNILVTDVRMLSPSRMAYPVGWTEEMIWRANRGPVVTDSALASMVPPGNAGQTPRRIPDKALEAESGEEDTDRSGGHPRENPMVMDSTPVRIDYLDLFDRYGWTYRLEEERGTEADFLHLANYREMWERRNGGKELQQIVIAPGTRGTTGSLLKQAGVKTGRPDHYFILYRMKR